MKISKLFHWLYAFIMFLPVFSVGGKLAYTIFNKNAKDSYTGQDTSYFENVDANSNITSLETYYFIFKITNLNPNNFDGRTYQFNNVVQIQPASYANYLTPSCSIRFYNDGTNKLAITSSSNATAYVNLATINLEFTCNFANDVNVYSTNFVNTLYTLEYNQNAMLDNAFYYAVDQVRDNVLFSWANNSFLATPITYVTDLFGMPSDSPIITYLSYWLDISIIWLTFDVILYVPLLVHRWLDKGVLE